MKLLFVLASFLVVSVLAADQQPVVPIVAYESEVKQDGGYHYSFETGDGVKASQDGTVKQVGEELAGVVTGEYSYPGEDGKPVVVQYVADENGYQPTGDSIPKVPAQIARALQWIKDHPQPEEGKKQ